MMNHIVAAIGCLLTVSLTLYIARSMIFLVLAVLAFAPPTLRMTSHSLLLPFHGCALRALACMTLIAHMTAVMRRHAVKEANLAVRMATVQIQLEYIEVHTQGYTNP